MQIVFLLEDAEVLLADATDIEAIVVNGADVQTFSLLAKTVKKWTNGSYRINAVTANWKQGTIELSYRTVKNGNYSEWYKQLISYKQ